MGMESPPFPVKGRVKSEMVDGERNTANLIILVCYIIMLTNLTFNWYFANNYLSRYSNININPITDGGRWLIALVIWKTISSSVTQKHDNFSLINFRVVGVAGAITPPPPIRDRVNYLTFLNSQGHLKLLLLFPLFKIVHTT